MILRLILFLIFVYFGIKTVITIFRYVKGVPPEKSQIHGTRHGPLNEMVQDPICGTYIVKEEALSWSTPDGVKYFCSEKCRNQFLERQTNE